jgi:excisionase family DNA binding protein
MEVRRMANAQASERLLVTIPEAAALLSLGRSTVYELVQRNKLPVVHIGRAVRVRVDDLRLFAAGWGT